MLLLFLLSYLKLILCASVVTVQLSPSNPADTTHVQSKASNDFVAGSNNTSHNAEYIQQKHDLEDNVSSNDQIASSRQLSDSSENTEKQNFDRYILPINSPPTVQTIYASSKFIPFEDDSETNSNFKSSGNYTKEAGNQSNNEGFSSNVKSEKLQDQQYKSDFRNPGYKYNQPYVNQNDKTFNNPLAHEESVNSQYSSYQHENVYHPDVIGGVIYAPPKNYDQSLVLQRNTTKTYSSEKQHPQVSERYQYNNDPIENQPISNQHQKQRLVVDPRSFSHSYEGEPQIQGSVTYSSSANYGQPTNVKSAHQAYSQEVSVTDNNRFNNVPSYSQSAQYHQSPPGVKQNHRIHIQERQNLPISAKYQYNDATVTQQYQFPAQNTHEKLINDPHTISYSYDNQPRSQGPITYSSSANYGQPTHVKSTHQAYSQDVMTTNNNQYNNAPSYSQSNTNQYYQSPTEFKQDHKVYNQEKLHLPVSARYQYGDTLSYNQPISSQYYQSPSEVKYGKLVNPQMPRHNFVISHQPQSYGTTSYTTSASTAQPILNVASSSSHPSSEHNLARLESTASPTSSFAYSSPQQFGYSEQAVSSIPAPAHYQQSSFVNCQQPSSNGYSARVTSEYQSPTYYNQYPSSISHTSSSSSHSSRISSSGNHIPIVEDQQYIPITQGHAFPTVQHIPTVNYVPVTQVHSTPGVIQKTVNVAQPVLQTKTYEVRRPAVQKQYYDIEERVIVRPAGSVVVELDQPVSKIPKGETIQSVGHPQITHARQEHDSVNLQNQNRHPADVVIQQQQQQQQLQQDYNTDTLDHNIQNAQHISSTTPAPIHVVSSTTLPSSTVSSDEDSIIIEAAKLKQANDAIYHNQQINEKYAQNNISSFEYTQQNQYPSQIQNGHLSQGYNIGHSTPFMIAIGEPDFRYPPYVEARSNGEPSDNAKFRKSHGAYSVENQQIFRGDIPQPADYSQQNYYTSSVSTSRTPIYYGGQDKYAQNVVLGQQGLTSEVSPNNGVVKTRVIAASPTAKSGIPTGEQIHNRRIVISQPVETIQHVQEQVPYTKVHQVTVNQPTVYKTTSVGLKPIQTTVPVHTVVTPVTSTIQSVHPVTHYTPINVGYPNVQYDQYDHY